MGILCLGQNLLGTKFYTPFVTWFRIVPQRSPIRKLVLPKPESRACRDQQTGDFIVLRCSAKVWGQDYCDRPLDPEKWRRRHRRVPIRANTLNSIILFCLRRIAGAWLEHGLESRSESPIKLGLSYHAVLRRADYSECGCEQTVSRGSAWSPSPRVQVSAEAVKLCCV